jgi:hypothetical protein
MANETDGAGSPHAIAYALLERIAHMENKSIHDPTKGATRAYILETYKECIHAVLDIRKYGPFA